MKRVKLVVLSLFAALLVLPALMISTVEGDGPTEAPTGFDNLTNGASSQAIFDADKEVFDEFEEVDEGLGPIFNAAACVDCHAHPVSGGISQITELRAGHFNGSIFIDHPGGSLIGSRAIDPSIQEHILDGNEVRTFRTSLNLLGDGFIECIANSTIRDIADDQPRQSGGRISGRVVNVPVLEDENQGTRVGRFGWKLQHASLISFSADAYLNEMGITSPLQPDEQTFMGDPAPVAALDEVEDPEEEEGVGEEAVGPDILFFARFMRATKAPPRGPTANSAEAVAGSNLFNQIGCAICHVRTIVTAPAGTSINQGEFTVPPALGNKIIHPFSDFLLHNLGTGDGIVQNGGQATRNEMRTPALWGVRTRNRLMHDGESLTFNEAILRHGGEATFVTNNYRNLSQSNKNRIIAFLKSL